MFYPLVLLLPSPLLERASKEEEGAASWVASRRSGWVAWARRPHCPHAVACLIGDGTLTPSMATICAPAARPLGDLGGPSHLHPPCSPSRAAGMGAAGRDGSSGDGNAFILHAHPPTRMLLFTLFSLYLSSDTTEHRWRPLLWFDDGFGHDGVDGGRLDGPQSGRWRQATAGTTAWDELRGRRSR
jgi:hypothetical protein